MGLDAVLSVQIDSVDCIAEGQRGSYGVSGT